MIDHTTPNPNRSLKCTPPLCSAAEKKDIDVAVCSVVTVRVTPGVAVIVLSTVVGLIVDPRSAVTVAVVVSLAGAVPFSD